jgi:hypothetical protein
MPAMFVLVLCPLCALLVVLFCARCRQRVLTTALPCWGFNLHEVVALLQRLCGGVFAGSAAAMGIFLEWAGSSQHQGGRHIVTRTCQKCEPKYRHGEQLAVSVRQ